MKTCAYCGRENPDDRVHCQGCGLELAVPAAEPARSEAAGESEPSEMIPDVPPGGESALCTACLFPNLPEAQWCKRCGAPLGATTTLVFPEAAQAAGFVYRRAFAGRPSRIVLFTIWFLFLPGLLMNVFTLADLFSGRRAGGWPGVATLLLTLGGGTLCFLMLYRVTRNFLTLPLPKSEDGSGPAGSAE